MHTRVYNRFILAEKVCVSAAQKEGGVGAL